MLFRKIDNVIKIQISLFFQRDHWRLDVVAKQTSCHTIIAYRWESNLQKYDKIERFHYQRIDFNRRITILIKKNMLEFQRSHFWIYDDELTIFFEKEWNIKVHQKTICNILKKKIVKKNNELNFEMIFYATFDKSKWKRRSQRNN